MTQIGVAGAGLVPDVTVHPVSLTYSGAYRREREREQFLRLGQPGTCPAATMPEPASFRAIPRPSRCGRRRARCESALFLARWGFNHNRALPRDWQFRWGMSGQVTRDMLIPGEQFGIGGADSVRGFLEREIINDNGYRGTLELYGPDFGAKVPVAGARMRALAFTDWGW